MISLDHALQEARARIPASEARLLLREALNCSAVWLEVHADDVLVPEVLARFRRWVERRAAGEPVAYLLGQREFYGRDFRVSSDVLIPRPDTEVLVDCALARARALKAPRMLDLGTGSGCIAITLALELPQARVVAVDLSAGALQVAQENAQQLGATVSFAAGNWFAPVNGQRFDIIVSNPPYIAEGDRHLSEGDLRFEPISALTSGGMGLDDILRIAAEARAHLNPDGWLMLEHGYDQATAVAAILAANGLTDIEHHLDLAGIQRVTVGRWAA